MSKNIIRTSSRQYIFLITIVCIIIGVIFRIGYCLLYPVQPRDAYSYGNIISQWENNGTITNDKVIIPFSLWIIKLPHHFFHYDAVKTGIIVNMILGVLIITIGIYSIQFCFNRHRLINALFAGLVFATHPSLVRFSCTCLRENTYLFFSLLTFFTFAYYCRFPILLHVFAISILGALAFLCRLEGLEILLIFFITLFFLCLYKKIKITNAFIHAIVFLVMFFATVLYIYYGLNFKFVTKDLIVDKVSWNYY